MDHLIRRLIGRRLTGHILGEAAQGQLRLSEVCHHPPDSEAVHGPFISSAAAGRRGLNDVKRTRGQCSHRPPDRPERSNRRLSEGLAACECNEDAALRWRTEIAGIRAAALSGRVDSPALLIGQSSTARASQHEGVVKGQPICHPNKPGCLASLGYSRV
jgi:hypothetical protein